MHRFELRVRYGDTDQMGWVYYGNYLRWFEIGRAEMMRSLGRSYREVEEIDGVLLPVLDARCRYYRGARYDERVAKPVRPPRALASLLAAAPRVDAELAAMFGHVPDERA